MIFKGVLRRLVFFTIAVVASGSWIAVPILKAEEPPAPFWPSEREQRLAEVTDQIFTAMELLSAASYHGRDQEVTQLSDQINSLKREQDQLRELPVSSNSPEP